MKSVMTRDDWMADGERKKLGSHDTVTAQISRCNAPELFFFFFLIKTILSFIRGMRCREDKNFLDPETMSA